MRNIFYQSVPDNSSVLDRFWNSTAMAFGKTYSAEQVVQRLTFDIETLLAWFRDTSETFRSPLWQKNYQLLDEKFAEREKIREENNL